MPCAGTAPRTPRSARSTGNFLAGQCCCRARVVDAAEPAAQIERTRMHVRVFAWRLGFDLSVCGPPPTYFWGRAPGPKNKNRRRGAPPLVSKVYFGLCTVYESVCPPAEEAIHVCAHLDAKSFHRRGFATSPTLKSPNAATEARAHAQTCAKPSLTRPSEAAQRPLKFRKPTTIPSCRPL